MGIVSWLLAGLLAGLLSFAVPALGPQGGCVANVGLGVLGALLGGALATALGFGGALGFDVRGALTAGLSAVLFLLAGRLARRPPP
ncbi:MAG TPA: GlsB/YeaQ/YmgE family stress response membrane protein [Thermoanaerobaculia bacterium]|nr:GlsB/YeaQ/YmgE family stress response membrane protein [Thermoanaerobaculia bacterium]